MKIEAGQSWHVAQWGFWGWVETILKLVGIGAGIFAGVNALSGTAFIIEGNPELAALILFTLLALGYIVALVLRFIQKEVISFAFAIINFIGHWGAVLALLRLPDQPTLPLIMAVFFVLGELAKQRFLAESGYTEAGQTPARMRAAALFVLATYVLVALALLL